MWPRWGRGRTCCSPMFAVPAIARQSLISEPPSRRRLVGSSYRRSTTRAATWPQQAPPSPLRPSAGRPTSRCGAPPARALPCPSARSRRAHRGHGTLTPPSEPAGGSLLPPRPPPRVGRSSSAIIAGCTFSQVHCAAPCAPAYRLCLPNFNQSLKTSTATDSGPGRAAGPAIDPSTGDRYDQLFHNIAYQHGEALLTAPAAGRCVGAYGAGPAPAVLYGGGRRD